MEKEIIQKENKILRKIAEEIKLSDIKKPKIQNLIKDMRKTLSSQIDGVALAAPQIAVSKQIFIINPEIFKMVNHRGVKETVFINPKIIKISKDKKKMEEGCLSVRPLYGLVKRASRATIEAYNEKGEKFIMEGKGLLAQVFQHETDHLMGILIIDKATNIREIPTDTYEQ